MQCSMMNKSSMMQNVAGRRYARASLRRSPLKVQAAKVRGIRGVRGEGVHTAGAMYSHCSFLEFAAV